MMKSITIADRQVGSGHPCFIIAEAGVNHNGDIALAKRLVEVAAQTGADAVKFQTFKAERVITPTAPKADYQRMTTDQHESQFEMVRRLELSEAMHGEIANYCQQQGILFLSTPFEEGSADLLASLDVPLFKIPSGEITNLPFLEYVARKGRPMIVSTGMASIGEVETALQVIEQAGNPPLVLLHCVSNYPSEPADTNLRAMQTMTMAFDVPVGYSDHTLGIEVPIAAVALGACVIEKHFTLDKTLSGPDHKASLEPHELSALVRGIRIVEKALGDGRKRPVVNEAPIAAVARKSLVASCDILTGTRLTERMIARKRPGTGLRPSMLPYLVGRTVCQDIPANTLFTLEMLY
jgi:N-acetylneuraminate synthase